MLHYLQLGETKQIVFFVNSIYEFFEYYVIHLDAFEIGAVPSD